MRLIDAFTHVLRNTTWSLILAAGIWSLISTDGFWKLAWANLGQVFSVGQFGLGCGCACATCAAADCSASNMTVTISGMSGNYCFTAPDERPCTDFDGTYVLQDIGLLSGSPGAGCINPFGISCRFSESALLGVGTCVSTYRIRGYLLVNGGDFRWYIKIDNSNIFFPDHHC